MPAAKLAVLLAGLALLWAAAPAAGSPASRAGERPRHSRPAPLYWGAQIGSQLTGERAPWDTRAMYKFARIAGKGLSLVEFAAPFVECTGSGCLPQRFPTTPLENARRYGAIPFFSWSSASTPGGLPQPNFQLADIIDGSHDAFIRYFAESAREWGHPFFLRFDWEMNGFWFPWSESANGNRVGEFAAAWRHVHDIFTSVGASNVTWVWCPNVNISGELGGLRSLYPGDAYVDWTCLDGFNWGTRRGSPGWFSFDKIFRSTYRQIVRRIAPRKPMVLAEVASSDRGGSKAAWIRDALHRVRTRYRKIHGLIWVDVNERNTHWPIETSRRARNAFRRGIRSRAYIPNVFGQLSTSPIPPPTWP